MNLSKYLYWMLAVLGIAAIVTNWLSREEAVELGKYFAESAGSHGVSFDAAHVADHWRMKSSFLIAAGAALAAGGTLSALGMRGGLYLILLSAALYLCPSVPWVLGYQTYAFEKTSALEFVGVAIICLFAFAARPRQRIVGNEGAATTREGGSS